MFSSTPTDAPLVREPLHAPVAHLVRGGVTEGVHYGSVVVLGAGGEVTLQLGDIEAAFYPRSALKPVQAVAMVRAGLPLDGGLLSLAAASHSGEERHLAGTRRILEEAGVTEDDLRNVEDLPYGAAQRDQWIREGRGPSRLAHNCSGKHAAMLYTCKLNGWSLEGYLDPGHPLQQAIAEIVEDLTGQRIAQVTVDGCGAPLFSVSLHGLARAAARITTAVPGTPEAKVAAAMRDFPEMASGTDRDVAALMRAVPGLLAKDGFEGVEVAALPDGRAVAVKISDGANRARVPVTAAALARAGVDPARLTAFAGEPLLGGGEPVGEIRAVRALDPVAFPACA
ncbi:asparaginase [Streptomyces acidiscabies]|uniref:Asparaginase n=3 Tax=Streptomyces acidiscabies TaxID=42234 RepID=A0AAP6EGI9_9ACTN|nr:asparaginase [Streptomyces acidiscabies]MBP5935082.1 asparaginase [Streptomyces sp. LBUM 1476]MBZ3917130.1 asparaginase [Streptomyces acidiscabies]MDX2961370.1 asparaginase [Streptomyces acidiscabies]MDX3022728.1 asparaginase [Streptomyces acidiscabies]MDX3792092.1 asparaginase [Streptomyces acidiscabies]